MDENPAEFLPQVEEVEARLRGVDLSDAVLLTGSSIMEFWHTSAGDLQPLRAVNVAIGGTRLGDHIAYFSRLVLPARPRALVLYAGSNDMNGVPERTKSAAETAALAWTYLDLIHAHLPATPVFYIAILLAPCKRAFFAEIQAANRLIRADIARRPGFAYIDCGPALRGLHGEPDETLYLEDRLHLSPTGYARWGACVKAGLRPLLPG